MCHDLDARPVARRRRRARRLGPHRQPRVVLGRHVGHRRGRLPRTRLRSPVVCLFDHEEIGSQSATGAGSSILATVLERIVLAAGGDRDGFHRALAGSVLRVGRRRARHAPQLRRAPRSRTISFDIGGGPVLKRQRQRALRDRRRLRGALRARLRAAGVPLQRFVLAHRHAVRLDDRARHRGPPRRAHRRRRHPPALDALGPRAVRRARPGACSAAARRVPASTLPSSPATGEYRAAVTHPLDPLTADEISRAADALPPSTGDDASPLFSTITLDEPTSRRARRPRSGTPVDRRAASSPSPVRDSLPTPIVSLDATSRVDASTRPRRRGPPLLFDEVIHAGRAR